MENKTFRLFVSSTFNDFLLEREILNNDIFPEIDAFCKQYGFSFQLVDLRWGVNTESSLHHNTLSICLNEVRRCRQLSPKPNFLLMVGERYGWVPLPAILQKEELETILSVADDEEKSILQQWYVMDEKEIGGIYYLRTRTEPFDRGTPGSR